MAGQTIIQTVISSVETFDGNKNNFEAWIASLENAVQISGQDILQTAISKIVGLPLIPAHRLRDRSPNIMQRELKSKLSRKYFSIPFDSHATQDFTHLQQGPDSLLEMFSYHAR